MVAVASYPGAGEGERAPGTHCVRMRVISERACIAMNDVAYGRWACVLRISSGVATSVFGTESLELTMAARTPAALRFSTYNLAWTGVRMASCPMV